MAGKLLPSESDCVAHFKISRPTVRQAMVELQAQGLVDRGRGRGTFVAPPIIGNELGRTFETERRAANSRVKFKLLSRERVSPPAAVCAALKISRQVQVERVTRLR